MLSVTFLVYKTMAAYRVIIVVLVARVSYFQCFHTYLLPISQFEFVHCIVALRLMIINVFLLVNAIHRPGVHVPP